MTKVQIRFTLRKPLDEPLLARLPGLYAKYGILKIQFDDSLGLVVEYDATRLRPPEVEAALGAAGISIAHIPPRAP
jgi:hypothetical protein